MKKVIHFVSVVFFVLNMFLIADGQTLYDPKLNVITDPTDIQYSGYVKYTTTNASNEDLRFTLLGDGYFTNLNEFNHQFQPNPGYYETTTYFSEKYKPHIPTVRNKFIHSTGSGMNRNASVSMPFSVNSRVATSWQPTPGFENFYMLIFENTTAITDSGCIEFYYNDTDLLIDTSGILEYGWVNSRVISNISAGTPYNKKIKWNFTNLLPGEQRIVYIPMITTAGIGSLMKVGSKYLSNCNSSTGAPNSSYFLASGSPHDPNSKTANKDCVKNYVGNGQPITYTIRFQNEGDGPAKDVILVDVLDKQVFDLKSLVFLDSEYDNYSYSLEGNVLNIKFANIYLPGLKQRGRTIYTYEETESFVQFQICTLPMLEPGIIENQVSIIFDDQPAILTNVSKVNIINDCANEPCESSKITNTNDSDALNIVMSPNPVEDILLISGLEDHKVTVNIYNNQGELIYSKIDVDRINGQLELGSFSSGLYFIQVRNEMFNFTKKILKL